MTYSSLLDYSLSQLSEDTLRQQEQGEADPEVDLLLSQASSTAEPEQQ